MPIVTDKPNRRFYNIAEVAEILRCSTSTVRWLISTGRLTSIKPARRRLVSVEVLDAFIASGAGR